MTSRQFAFSPWRKSSHSGSEGQMCVEAAAIRRKSSHSGSGGSSCVEVATLNCKCGCSGSESADYSAVVPLAEAVALRDSKDVDGPVLAVGASGWASLLAGIKGGSFDLGS